MTKTKLALVGLGYWGKNLLRNLNNLGVLEVAFDADKQTLEKYKNDKVYSSVKFRDDYEDCLFQDILDIDGVVVATPPDTHYDVAMFALRTGRHVFIEKPMTLSAEQAEEIVKVAESKGLIVMVGHIFLYCPEILKLKEIITSEDFGDIYYIYTKRLNLGQVQSCGVVNDLIPHDISVVDFLLDRQCTEISAYGMSNILDGVDDVAFVRMKYGEVSAHLHLSWLDPLKVRDTIVVGSKRMAVCDSIAKKITIYDKGIEYLNDKGLEVNDYARHLMRYRYGDVVMPYIDTYEPLLEECKEFCRSIEEGTAPKSNGKTGLSVVRTMLAAKKSLEGDGTWESV